MTRDYVTEKLVDPLVAGSVPLYRGRAQRRRLRAVTGLLRRRHAVRWSGQHWRGTCWR